MTNEEFLNFLGPSAYQIETNRGYPMEALLAQVHLESGELSSYPEGSNNVLGIKFSGEGEYVEVPTEEQDAAGNPTTIMAKFQKFASLYDCLTHWADLMDKPWYAQAQPYRNNWAAFLGLIWFNGEERVYATDALYQWKAIKRACDAGIPEWCAAYRAQQQQKPVAIRDKGGDLLCEGSLMDLDGEGPEPARTVVKLRDIADAFGFTTYWDAENNTAVIGFPGKKV